ncbi:MAG: hypothetical protein R2737_06515 [Candidatus Nanopelagicales bacterium]
MTTTQPEPAVPGPALPGPRPQPLGVLPWPAGMLVLATAPADAVAALTAGGEPDPWPDSLAYVRAALDGDAERAASLVPGDDAVATYNRAVLVGGDAVWDGLAVGTDGELRALVDTARFSLGLVDEPPGVAGCAGEVAAVVRSARASAALERGDVAAAVLELARAGQDATAGGSPLLAASLRATRADLLRERLDDPRAAAQEADAALRALPAGAPDELRAELLVTRALARQQAAGTDRGALLAVVGDLTGALKTYREDTHPEQFAACNQQLALAYLVMPMSDQGDRIRLGVAVTSLRAALRVFTPQTHPAAWASTQLNLANALQYLPSVHQEQNLDEAVQLYEELLQFRDPDRDPVGVARILANQGNALGHLGALDSAQQRLERARGLFAAAGDGEGVAGVDDILASVAEARARRDQEDG